MTRIFTLLLLASSLAYGSPEGSPIKVGVTEYQNTGQAYLNYRRFFHDLEVSSSYRLHFLIAIGTYDEVLKWRDEGSIDLAILSATPVVRILAVGNDADRRELQNDYLGHLTYFSSPGEGNTRVADLLPPDQRERPRDGYYRTICVVRKDSLFESFDDIVAAANKHDGSVKFLFVRPYSMSGYIHPRAVLNAAHFQEDKTVPAGIRDAEFTGQHDNSLTKLLQSGEEGKRMVAFVLEQTSVEKEQIAALQRIPVDGLEKVKMPQEAVFISTSFQSSERRRFLSEALQQLHPGGTRSCDANGGHFCFDSTPSAADWLHSYDALLREMQSISLPPNGDARADLTDLIKELQTDHESGVPTRVALVLSGGGAKCAYQVGAIKAIKEKIRSFEEQQRQIGKSWVPNIDLVVGTSGGAINALFFGLGIEDQLEGTWIGFDQRDLIDPGWPTRMLWGLFTGVAFFLIVFLISILAHRQRWWYIARGGLLILLSLTIYSAHLTFTKPYNHWLFHGVFLLRLSLISGSAVLVIAGLLTWLPRVQQSSATRVRTSAAIAALLVLCFAVLIVDIFWMNDALTDLSGARRTFVAKFPGFLHHPGDVEERLQGIDSQKNNKKDALNRKLALLSNLVISPPGGRDEFQRDMILTASRLPADNNSVTGKCNTSGNSLPNDLYFYYDVKAERAEWPKLPSNGDKRFISLRQNPYSLFDVVLGSSTIYPFFRAQPLTCLDVTRPDPNGASFAAGHDQRIGTINIVDGGFSHNSPLDAAINWGATHVLLIEASPAPSYSPPKTLAKHAGNAFNFLFDQAQGTDYRARGQVKIFELVPSPSCDEWFDPCSDAQMQWLDLIDFAKPLLERAIDHGHSDVAGSKPMFTRIPGPPRFVSADPKDNLLARQAR